MKSSGPERVGMGCRLVNLFQVSEADTAGIFGGRKHNMLYEKRQIKAEGYGNQEDALADLAITLPSSRVLSVKRLVSMTSGDPTFLIEIEVQLYHPEEQTRPGRDSYKKKKEDEDDD